MLFIVSTFGVLHSLKHNGALHVILHSSTPVCPAANNRATAMSIFSLLWRVCSFKMKKKIVNWGLLLREASENSRLCSSWPQSTTTKQLFVEARHKWIHARQAAPSDIFFHLLHCGSKIGEKNCIWKLQSELMRNGRSRCAPVRILYGEVGKCLCKNYFCVR